MWIDVSGGRLYVEVTGQGPPILLIHGWPLDHRMFSPQLGPLSETLKVIAYDRRGFGQSEVPPDLRLELDDIDRILDELGLESVHLLGMSQGGRIALRYAATRLQRVRSLILQGAVVDELNLDERGRDRVPVAEYANLAKDGKLREVKIRWLEHPMMQLDSANKNEIRLLSEIIDGYSGQDLIQFEPDNYAFSGNVLAAMSSFGRPVLILTGAKETETRRKHAAELLRRIPNCHEIILSQSGHLSNLTESDFYNNTVRDFCREAEEGAW